MEDEQRACWRVEREVILEPYDEISVRKELEDILFDYQCNGLERAGPFLPWNLAHSPDIFWKVIENGLHGIHRDVLKALLDRCIEPKILLVPQYPAHKLIQSINRHKPESQMGFFGDVYAPKITPFLTPRRSEIEVILTDVSPDVVSDLRLSGAQVRLAFDEKYIELANIGLDIADPATALLVIHAALHQSGAAVMNQRRKTIVELCDEKETLAVMHFLFADKLQIHISQLQSGDRLHGKVQVKPQLSLGKVDLPNNDHHS